MPQGGREAKGSFWECSSHLCRPFRAPPLNTPVNLIRPSMRQKLIANDLPALHYESDAFEFANISDRIAGNGDDVGEFSAFDGAHAVLPAQHFCSGRRDRANHVERGHSSLMQSGKP